MIEIISGTWAAGELKTFHVNGEYLEILDAQYPCDVMLMDRTGAQLSIMNNSEASFFSRPKEGFNTVQIKSAQAQAIRIFIGSGDAGTRRISSTVQVVDGERARTNAGVMFAASGVNTPVAAQYPRVQLWNPVGSGKRLVVGRVGMSSAAVAQACVIFGSGVAEANDGTSGWVYNKLLGQAVGVAQVRWGNNAAAPTSSMFGTRVQADQLIDWKPVGVLVINPGIGLIVGGLTVNTSVTGNFEWFEEAI
jgi:hypothetical protein